MEIYGGENVELGIRVSRIPSMRCCFGSPAVQLRGILAGNVFDSERQTA